MGHSTERSGHGRHRRDAQRARFLGPRASARSASSMAISAPARSMPSARRCMPPRMAGASDREAVLGVLSLILWALIIIVTLKYVLLLLRADNKGEGGTLSLMALAQRAIGRAGMALVLLGIIGAALFYGDAIITPAISVLSAVEGLERGRAALRALRRAADGRHHRRAVRRAAPRHGARRRASSARSWLVWFVVARLSPACRTSSTIPASCARSIRCTASRSCCDHGMIGLRDARRGVPGGDRRARRSMPISAISAASRSRSPGSGCVLPGAGCSTISARARWSSTTRRRSTTRSSCWPGLGAGADGRARDGRHRHRQPGGDHRRLFADPPGDPARPAAAHRRSSTPPRRQSGQIYMPQVNWLLFVGVIAAGAPASDSSAALAAAYGIAVTGDDGGRPPCWPSSWSGSSGAGSRWPAALVIVPFLVIDLAFLGANLLKIVRRRLGAARCSAALVIAVMMTWRRGTRILLDKTRRDEVPLRDHRRQPGEAQAAASRARHGHLPHQRSGRAPTALLHSLKHYKVLHEKNIILTIETTDTPRVAPMTSASAGAVSASFTGCAWPSAIWRRPTCRRRWPLCRKAGLRLRHHVDLLLPVAPRICAAPTTPACRAGRRKLYMVARPQCRRRQRLFLDSVQPRRRDRHAGAAVSAVGHDRASRAAPH